MLVPLGLQEMGRLVADSLHCEQDSARPLAELVHEKTGGNPFFIEEIVQGLFDDGALVRNGTVKVTRSLLRLRLPPTVQGMLAARIDQLPAVQKELLQTLGGNWSRIIVRATAANRL